MSTFESLNKRQKVVQLLDHLHLPPPVIGHTLEYLDIPALVQVAACNSAWQREVYEENPQLWKEIQFTNHKTTKYHPIWSEDEFNQARKMKDRHLAALLRRCKARDRCQVLKLTGCIRLTGCGLEPLRGSCVLREIDLRLCGPVHSSPSEIDLDEVLPILDSIAPMCNSNSNSNGSSGTSTETLGLMMVKFDRSSDCFGGLWGSYDSQISRWIQKHGNCLVEAAKKNRLTCDFCQRDIVEVSKPEDLMAKFLSSYCESCKKMTCSGQHTDCPWTRECHQCNVQCCQLFSSGNTKGSCHCPNHPIIKSCGECNRYSCENCWSSGDFCSVTCEEQHLRWSHPYFSDDYFGRFDFDGWDECGCLYDDLSL